MAWFGRRRSAGVQGIQVSERNGIRYLHIDSDAIQSAMQIDRPYELHLTYSRCVFAPLLFAPVPQRVYIVGLGGGSIPKFIHRFLPEVGQTVVEIDPRVIAIARQQFMLPPDDPQLKVLAADGAEALRGETDPQDWILLDGFHGSAPDGKLTSEDFYAECAARLSPQGVLIVNVWSTAPDFQSQIDRVRRVFDGRVLVLPAGERTNVLIMGFASAPRPLEWAALRIAARQWESALQLPFGGFLDDLRRANPHDARRLLLPGRAD